MPRATRMTRRLLARVFMLTCAVLGTSTLVSADEMLVCSLINSSVQRYDAETGVYLGPLVRERSGGVLRPHSFTIGPDHSVYCASFSNSSVIRFDARTSAFIETFVPEGSGGLDGATEVLFGPDGHLYVASFRNAAVLRFDADTGEFIDEFVKPGSGGMVHPELMAFGPNGDLYVASMGTHEILRYDGESGEFTGAFIPSGFAGIRKPHAMLFHKGHLYVSSFEAATVHRFDARTGEPVDLFIRPGTGGLARAHGMSIGPDGHLYVCSFATDQILKYDGTTGDFMEVVVDRVQGTLDGPTVVMFVSDLRPRLRRIHPGRAGEVNRLIVTGARPESQIVFVYSDRPGVAAHPRCPGIHLDIARPVPIGVTRVDKSGVASLRLTIPPAASGRYVAVQAIDVTNCLPTNPVLQRIQ